MSVLADLVVAVMAVQELVVAVMAVQGLLWQLWQHAYILTARDREIKTKCIYEQKEAYRSLTKCNAV